MTTLVRSHWLWIVAISAYLATRLPFLDRDVPPWNLAQYQPIDESAYTLPAFNLHDYGTWTHQEVPWVPLEGSPMNVFQSLVTSLTLQLDWTYLGFRLSSVLFGLVAFAAMLAVVRHLAQSAAVDRQPGALPASWIVAGALLLLLFDFSFLLGGRIVEATIARLAELAVVLWLVARGSLLGASHSNARSFSLGFAAGLAMTFGYIYNAFFVVGAVLAVAGWAATRGWAVAARHVALVVIGSGLSIAIYFGWVYLVYRQGPAEWYATWVAVYRESGRAATLDPSALWDALAANVFRLDRPFMAMALAGLPAFAWWTWRSRNPLGLAVLAFGVAFAAQAVVQSDYPNRKMLMLLPFALPIAVGGALRMPAFVDWVRERRLRLAAWVVYLAAVVVGSAILILPPGLVHWTRLAHLFGLPSAAEIAYRDGTLGLVLVLAGLAGVAAVGVLFLAWRRQAIARLAAVALLATMLGPLAAFDMRYVYTDVTTTYRDAMISVGQLPDAAVIAGGSSHAMQLYNSSRAVLQGNVFGMTVSAYEAAVVRFFAEGRARWLFGYSDPAGQARWTGLGFRLVETYPIVLPKDRRMGRYEYVGPSAPSS